MVKLFLDANIYLDLYSSKAVNRLLDPLIEISGHVIVTEQVVSEVYRNKLRLAMLLLESDHNKFDLSSLPDALVSNAADPDPTKAREKVKELTKAIKDTKERLKEIYDKAIEHVAQDEDQVSQQLAKIFSNAIKPNATDLDRARIRKKLGNPPGKKSDPIGDELSWEMILRYAQEKKSEVWIVSRDGDYLVSSPKKRVYPNPYLLKETKDARVTARFFEDLSTALEEFKAAHQKTLTLPTKEDLDAAKKAQRPKSYELCCANPKITIRQNGIFEAVLCESCGTQLAAYLAGCE